MNNKLRRSKTLEVIGKYIELTSINQSINQSVRPIVAELLLSKVRNEKRKRKQKKDGYEKLIVCSV